MATVEWCERHSVGIKELDEQHCRLFDIFYTLLEVDGTTQDQNIVADALISLRAYTYEHFATEERYMAECGYPDLESHRRIHNTFREKIENLYSAKPGNQNLMVILRNLYEWLITHIGWCDQQYIPYVTGQKT